MSRRGWAVVVTGALLAFPRRFRRRFGEEMREHFLLDTAGRGFLASMAALAQLVSSGLRERGSALRRSATSTRFAPLADDPVGRPRLFWDGLAADARQALRSGITHPASLAVPVTTLALGIGVTAALLIGADTVLRRPLPFRDSDRLVSVWSDATVHGRSHNPMSPANYRDFAALNRTLEGLDAYFSFITPVELTDGGPSEVVTGMTLTPGTFDLLGVPPLLGRSIARGEEHTEIVLSHGFWQRRFGASPAVIGRTVRVANGAAVIVGVMPRGFLFPTGQMLGPSGFTRVTDIDVWLPMRFSGPLASANRILDGQGQVVRGVHWLGAVGRMKPGVTVADVRADLASVARHLEQSHPATNRGWGVTIVPTLEQAVGVVRAPFLVLLGGVATVLLMATVNVANLALARGIARQRELATRAALGAGRGRLVQLAFAEGLVTAALGGGAALGVCYASLHALVALAPPDFPRLREIAADGRLFALVGLLALVSGLVLGVLPAIAAARLRPQSALRDHGRGTLGGAFHRRAQAALVVTQVALAVALLVSTGLLLRTFVTLMAADPGFQIEQLLTWQMNLPDRLRTQEERTVFYREFLDRVRALPGVISVGGTTRLPLGSTGLTAAVEIAGRPRPPAEWPEVQFRRSIGDYFQTMGVPVMRGRTFTDRDGPDAPPVCVVNETFVRRLFGGAEPIGQHVRLAGAQSWSTVIGVIADIKHGALDEAPQPELYVTHLQGAVVSPYLVLRTRGAPEDLADMVRAEARRLDDDLPIYQLQTMRSVRAASLAQRRFVLVLSIGFGLTAMLLAALGVYGVMSLRVGERTSEVGLRLALGARPAAVVALLLAQAARLVAVGLVIGGGAALLTTPLLAGQLFGVPPRDPLTLAAVPAILLAVALLAAWLPARRAVRLSPLDALRHD